MKLSGTQKISNFLRETQETLNKLGHTKYKLTNSIGEVCLVGAMNIVLNGEPDFVYGNYAEDNEQRETAAYYINLALNFQFSDDDDDDLLNQVVNWNNKDTTDLSVLNKVLTEAADIAESIELSIKE